LQEIGFLQRESTVAWNLPSELRYADINEEITFNNFFIFLRSQRACFGVSVQRIGALVFLSFVA
jgi:hypothetical protein